MRTVLPSSLGFRCPVWFLPRASAGPRRLVPDPGRGARTAWRGEARAGPRRAVAAARVAWEVCRQAANEATGRTTREFEAARAESLELSRTLPDLESRAAVGMDRLLRAREQLREHLAEILRYAPQSREDLDPARPHLHADHDTVLRQRSARCAPRLAPSASGPPCGAPGSEEASPPAGVRYPPACMHYGQEAGQEAGSERAKRLQASIDLPRAGRGDLLQDAQARRLRAVVPDRFALQKKGALFFHEQTPA